MELRAIVWKCRRSKVTRHVSSQVFTENLAHVYEPSETREIDQQKSEDKIREDVKTVRDLEN